MVVTVVAVVVAVATYLTWIAKRLDRLAIRVESLWAALDTQLTARAAAAHELAHQLDDPALHDAAKAAAAAGPDLRELAENDLSRALHVALPDGVEAAQQRVHAGSSPQLPPRSVDDPVFAALPADARPTARDLEVVLVKVSLTRQFYNDAVRDLLILRARRLPRLLRLYGTAQAPSYFEFDASVPEPRRVAPTA